MENFIVKLIELGALAVVCFFVLRQNREITMELLKSLHDLNGKIAELADKIAAQAVLIERITSTLIGLVKRVDKIEGDIEQIKDKKWGN